MDINLAAIIRSPKTHKFIVVGDSECGRTSLLSYFCANDEADIKVSKTIGCDIHVKEIIIKNDEAETSHYVEFWDIAADIQYPEILKVYLQSLAKEMTLIKGVIFLFDASNIKTLLHISKYLEGIVQEILWQNKLPIDDDKEINRIPLLLIGNNYKLAHEEGQEKKIQTIKEYISCIFDDNPKLRFSLLSTQSTPDEFKNFEDFIRDCIQGNLSNVFLYGPNQVLYPHDRFTNYTKKKLTILTKDFKKARHYISLKMLHFYTIMTALTFTFKRDEVGKGG